jgi:hypothetical protein
MSDIVERLRFRADENYEMLANIHEPLLEAADEIERLRAALEPFAKAAENFDTLKAFQDPEQFFAYSGIRSNRGVTGYISVAHLRRARATLEGK